MTLGQEPDFTEKIDRATRGAFLPGTAIEIIRKPRGRGHYRHALFDFDGTLSLIREGWQDVMIPMMVEALLGTPDHEPDAEVEGVVRGFVTQLTGKQTIYQMMRLCEEISKRGGDSLPASDYKQLYLDRLDRHISSRKDMLNTGKASPAQAKTT